MPPTKVTIILDQPIDKIYHSEDVISGRVVLKTTKSIRPSSLNISLQVVSKTKFLNVYHTSSTNNLAKSTEELFKEERVKKFEESHVISRSKKYPFTFIIPKDQPQSFESDCGTITFSINAVFENSGIDKVCKSFLVRNRFCRELYDMGMVQEGQAIKHFGKQNEECVEMSWFIPRKCYESDEVISTSITVWNNSQNVLKNIRSLLIQRIKYNGVYTTCATANVNKVEEKIVGETRKSFECLQNKNERCGHGLYIPLITPTINNVPNIIIDYYIKIELELNNETGDKMDMTIPLLILPYSNTRQSSRPLPYGCALLPSRSFVPDINISCVALRRCLTNEQEAEMSRMVVEGRDDMVRRQWLNETDTSDEESPPPFDRCVTPPPSYYQVVPQVGWLRRVRNGVSTIWRAITN